MKRREFIALLGGAAATWSPAARAQRPLLRCSPAARGDGGCQNNSDHLSLAGDPVKQGIVSSLNRPGGNVTGVTSPPLRSAPSVWSRYASFLPQPREPVLVNVQTNI